MTSHDTVTFDAPPDAGTLSRRRELSATARSLLLTVLGEFVLPRGEPVWTRALLDLLGELGVEQKSARQALSRTAAEGLIDSSREGRRVRWELTESGHRLLSAGAHRIYTFGTSEVAWDGRWLVLLASVPESRRQLRHRLRTRLAWAGFGSPAPAVWLSPDAEKQAEAAEVIRELGLAEVASSFIGPFGPIGEQREMVAQAWNLDRVELAYQDFIATFQRAEPTTPADVAREQINLVHAWRRFPFLDPQLPAELLPSGWIGVKATELFHDRHRRWDADARRHWEHLLRTAD
ncbi:phenylacetic acid degradation operon negative regulatory protein [Pseudonocardia eucalypti]|nr:phenylacetic acid degradation operon negative regulatory protein [Pseudonocardia eucalypti]